MINKEIEMGCKKCGLQKFSGPAGYAAPQCICTFTGNGLIQAAAWHAAQRDIILQRARDNAQMELPLETHETFKNMWATYRDGQRTMCEAISSYVEQTGHTGLALRIKNKFLGSGK
jgi:hypothetical protein